MSQSSQDNIEKTDGDLVLLVLQNKDFFVYLINRYESQLGRYIKRITQATEEDVEDVLQEVFVKAYVNLNSFDPKLKFSSWLYRITYHEVISRYRKIQIRPEGNTITIEDNDFSQFGEAMLMEEEFDEVIRGVFVRKALNSLDIKYRQVLILRFMEDKSYDEISDIIKKPPGTVATLIHRAKKKLKDIIVSHPQELYEK